MNPADLPAPVVYADEVAQSGGVVVHGFQLCAFESSLVLPLEAATNDFIALLEELNDRLSQVLPAQLQRHAAAEGLDIDAVMRSAAGDLCVYVMDPPLKGRACGLPLAVSSLPLGLLLPP